MEKRLLDQASEILYDRAEEKERQYGSFTDSMSKAARVATELCNKLITTEDFYKCMIALKMSRLAYNLKRDTFLDGITYTAALFEAIEELDEQARPMPMPLTLAEQSGLKPVKNAKAQGLESPEEDPGSMYRSGFIIGCFYRPRAQEGQSETIVMYAGQDAGIGQVVLGGKPKIMKDRIRVVDPSNWEAIQPGYALEALLNTATKQSP